MPAVRIEQHWNTLEEVQDELPSLVVGGLKADGTPNEPFLDEVKRGLRGAFCFCPGYTALPSIATLISRAATRKDVDGLRICPGHEIPGRELFYAIAALRPVSLLSLARLHLVCRAIVANRDRPKIAEAASAVRSVIGENGFRTNSFVMCLHVWNRYEAAEFRDKLAKNGAPALSSPSAFSDAVLADGPLRDHPARSKLIHYLEVGEKAEGGVITHRDYRVSQRTAVLVAEGCARVATKYNMAAPTIDDLFTCSYEAARNGGRSSVALPHQMGNQVR